VIPRPLGRGEFILIYRCAGYNNVYFKATRGRIHVVRVPACSPHAVAEHKFALMLSLNRKTHRSYWRTRYGNFTIDGLLGFNMLGKTAGIIETGKIGKVTAGILCGFGMRVLVHDAFPDMLITAHQGFFTREALENIAEVTLADIRDFFAGKPVENEICYQCDRESCRRSETGKCF